MRIHTLQGLYLYVENLLQAIISLVKTRNSCKLSLTRVILFLRTQTPHVHPMSFSFHRQSATKPSFQQLDIVQLSSPALLSYLQERGINTALAKRECREAHFTNNDKRYFAIAFPNISGRYEIRNRYFKGCIAPKDISISVSRESRERNASCSRA